MGPASADWQTLMVEMADKRVGDRERRKRGKANLDPVMARRMVATEI